MDSDRMLINGECRGLDSPGILTDILRDHGFDKSRIAVELNGRIIPKKDYDSVIVNDDDSLEIVGFVGGG